MTVATRDFARDYDRTVHGESSYFVWLNRGKESIELDLKDAADRPEQVHCSVSGYGNGGPDAMRKAYDLLIQCEAGLVEATGTPESPAKVGISVGDIAAGMYAYSGILAALCDREWAALCREAIGRPELTADPRFAHNPKRVEHDTDLTEIIEACFAGLDRPGTSR